jgi:hypothetical protein
MGHDDGAARHARAERLRAEIERIKGGKPGADSPSGSPETESPRDFVERRVRELTEAETEQDPDAGKPKGG